MGYELHITRKENWCDDTGPVIDETEWRRIIEEDPELSLDLDTRCVMSDGEFVFAAWSGGQGLLGWYRGEIVTKNAVEPLIAKMVQIASELGATVRGEAGEIYSEDGSSFQPQGSASPPPRPGLMGRLVSWLRDRRTHQELHRAAPPFRVGDRVKDPWGRFGTVFEVDRRANHGLGSVRVRFDDGRTVNVAYVASGLELVAKPSGG